MISNPDAPPGDGDARENDIIQQCAKVIDGRQQDAMCSKRSNINMVKNGYIEKLAEEPQAPQKHRKHGEWCDPKRELVPPGRQQ
jgi:hypothetical protein